MNAATAVRPEVTAFVARVREQLADLTEEEQEELVGGLEADLSEQAADGSLSLPDPAQYAAELRAAAGLPAARTSRLPRLGRPPSVADWPDAVRAGWFEVTRLNVATRAAWAFLEAVRPAWWVLRAWIAVTLLDQWVGPYEYVTLWPTLGPAPLGPLVLGLAVVVSVLMGQRKLWPSSGPARTTLARITLLSLNVLAVVVPLTFAGDGSQASQYIGPNGYYAGFHDGTHRPGLRNGADVVRNIYAYDAQGQPLVGVQLFDQRGRPVAVAPQSSMGQGRERTVTCPWVNGTTALFNVFPLQERLQRSGTCLTKNDRVKVGETGFAEPPLGSVPPATLPDGTAP